MADGIFTHRCSSTQPRESRRFRSCFFLKRVSWYVKLHLFRNPTGLQQMKQVVRWQIRKRVPFPLDDARLSMQRFPLPTGGERVAVVLGMDRVLGQYDNKEGCLCKPDRAAAEKL